MHKTKRVAYDFLVDGLEGGLISELELARWIVEGLDYDTDRVKELIKQLSEEQADFVLDWYDELETGDKNKELSKLSNASDLTHLMMKEYE